jgi:hypothetical protein
MGTARIPDRNISHTLFPYNMATACKWTTGLKRISTLKNILLIWRQHIISRKNIQSFFSVQIWQQQVVHRSNLMHPLPDKMEEYGCED